MDVTELAAWRAGVDRALETVRVAVHELEEQLARLERDPIPDEASIAFHRAALERYASAGIRP